jgi:TRAP-type C4-dicarboxylate transport system permease small subunit
VLALIKPYSSVMVVSLVVFVATLAALYFWTRGQASVAPAFDDAGTPSEATYR